MLNVEGRHPGVAAIARYFDYQHLLPDGPELTAGLRKLLEAKDCFVRAGLDL